MSTVFASRVVPGNIVLAAPFSDGAILQRNKPVPIWGTADAHEPICVSFAGQEVETRTDGDGRWKAVLQPMPASGEGRAMVVRGRGLVILNDVLVGDVWLCAGQSNMEWPLSKARDAEEEIAAAEFPLIRQLTLVSGAADHPVKIVRGEWRCCTPATAADFMATAYFFGREIFQTLGVPVGLLKAAVGGSPIEAWARSEILETDSWFASAWERWAAMKDVPQERIVRSRPSALYNGLVHPLEPVAMSGTLWYQGEANVSRAFEYRRWLTALIRQWRHCFQQEDLPFLIVQLPKFSPKDETLENSWALLRAAQADAARELPGAHLAVTLDTGEPDNIHPLNKQEVGRRLALLALAHVHQQPIEYSGPILKKIELQAETVRLHFEHAEGLAIAGDHNRGFEIAGADGKFFPAMAEVEGETIAITSDDVTEPAIVRFAWTNSPESFLFNGAGLPAGPFTHRLTGSVVEAGRGHC